MAAVGLVAAEKLPQQHTFPIELSITRKGSSITQCWRGEAIQVVIGNTRRYADIAEMTPGAYIDDGLLDVCVITAGGPLSTLEQVASLLLRRQPDDQTSESFRGAHITLRAPASIDLQLDGSAVKLKDYLGKADRAALEQAQDKDHVMVTYEFEALPRVLDVAFPATYNNALFEKSNDYVTPPTPEQQAHSDEQPSEEASQQNGAIATHPQQAPDHAAEQVKALLENGRKVTVVGSAVLSPKKQKYIIAGTTPKAATGEIKPVAIVIDSDTALFKRSGEAASALDALRVPEGSKIVVEGKRNKRGVIHPTRVVV